MKQITDFTQTGIEINLDIQRCCFGTKHEDCITEHWDIDLTTTTDDMLPMNYYATTAHKETILREYPELKESFDACKEFDIAEYHSETDDEDPNIIYSRCALTFLHRVPKSHLTELKYSRFIQLLAEGIQQ